MFYAHIDTEDEPETFDASFQRVQIMEELYISEYKYTDNVDVVSPGRITDVGIYHIVKETTAYGENRNFTISWTATGDDKNEGRGKFAIANCGINAPHRINRCVKFHNMIFFQRNCSIK